MADLAVAEAAAREEVFYTIWEQTTTLAVRGDGTRLHEMKTRRVGREPSGVMRRAAYRPFALLVYRNFHITLILLNFTQTGLLT